MVWPIISLLVNRDGLVAVDVGDVFSAPSGREFFRPGALSAIDRSGTRVIAPADRHGPHVELVAVDAVGFLQAKSNPGASAEELLLGGIRDGAADTGPLGDDDRIADTKIRSGGEMKEGALFGVGRDVLGQDDAQG